MKRFLIVWDGGYGGGAWDTFNARTAEEAALLFRGQWGLDAPDKFFVHEVSTTTSVVVTRDEHAHTNSQATRLLYDVTKHPDSSSD